MNLQKVISRKTFLQKLFFVGILKFNDEKSRSGSASGSESGSAPKMSWIPNAGQKVAKTGCGDLIEVTK